MILLPFLLIPLAPKAGAPKAAHRASTPFELAVVAAMKIVPAPAARVAATKVTATKLTAIKLTAIKKAPSLGIKMKPRAESLNEAPARPIDTFDMAAEEGRLVRVSVAGGTAQAVVSALVAQTKINLVLLESKPIPVTLKLKDVPLIEAVRHLCAMASLRYLRLPRTFVIGPDAALKAAYTEAYDQQYPAAPTPAPATPTPVVAPVTRVIKLSNISATAAATALKPFFDAKGVIAVAAPAVVSPTLANIDPAATTGATAGASGGGSSSGAGAGNAADHPSRTLILTGPPEEVERAAALIATIDVARAQVRVDVTMHDVNDDAMKDLGISWTFGNIDVAERSDRSFLFGKFDRSNLSASAVIHALETSDRARLLASPNITVQDGDNGYVLIGDRISYPVIIGYSNANTPIFDKQTERVGIYLQVGASVAQDGTVTMTLAPQVSTIKGYLSVNGASYPQVSTREAQSTIRVKSGQAIVLAGLMREEEVRSMERVPILSELPFLGELFRHRKKQKTSSQLIITVTPTIVKP